MNKFLHKCWKRAKRIQFLYFLRVECTNKDYHSALADMRTCAVKDKQTTKREMNLVRDYWHCPAHHYVRYRLFEKQLTDEQLTDYVPPYVFYTRHIPSLLSNAKIALGAFSSKVYQLLELSRRQVAVPGTVATVYRGKCHDLMGNEISDKALLESLGSDKFFCKPDDGEGGHGIVVLQCQEDGLFSRTANKMVSSLSDALRPNVRYVVQRQIRQIEFLDKIFPGSVNTLRMVAQVMDGELTIACCILRLGRGNNEVDNSAQGGMSVNVNLDTGHLDAVAITEHTNEKFLSHPDTGFVFENSVIPQWQGVKRQMVDIASKFTDIPIVGWDFALTPGGVVAVELNVGAGLDHMQLCAGPMRKKLNVRPVYGRET